MNRYELIIYLRNNLPEQEEKDYVFDSDNTISYSYYIEDEENNIYNRLLEISSVGVSIDMGEFKRFIPPRLIGYIDYKVIEKYPVLNTNNDEITSIYDYYVNKYYSSATTPECDSKDKGIINACP